MTIKYNIVERVFTLSKKGKWTKELNKISWNGRPVKYDLRDWNHIDNQIGKGTTLTEKELKSLREIINEIEL